MSNRREQQKKKQIVFLAAVGLVLVIGVVILIAGYTGKSIPTEYTINEDDDTVVYDGRSYRYNDHLSNYLFLGIDTREAVETYETRSDVGQADAIFLVSHDRAENSLKCLMIPRDTMTSVEMYAVDGTYLGSKEEHINIQYAFGDGRTQSCELMRDAVSKLLYGLSIQGYCSMNMDGIPVITDIIGGVEVTVPDADLEQVNPEFKEGATVTLTKDNVEQFVRYRDIEQSQSAIYRMDRHKAFIKAFVEKASERYAQDASLVGELYEGVQDYMVTNMSNDLFVDLLEASAGSGEILYTIPGKGVDDGYFDVYNVSENELFELVLQMFYVEVSD